jgi:hypothetical protein
MSLLTFPNQQKASEDARLALNPALILRFRNNFAEDFGRRTARNHGTYNGGVTPNRQGPLARAIYGGSSVLLNGSTGYVSCGTSVSLSPPATTYELWVKPSSLSNAYNAVIEKASASTTCGIFIKSNGKLAVYLTAGVSNTVNYDGTGLATLSAGNWYHLAFTYNSTVGLAGYVNGVLDGTAAANGTLTASAVGTLALGTDTINGGRFFSGFIGPQPSIYSTALTVNQISMLYEIDTGKWIPGKRVYSFASGGAVLRRILTRQAA